MVLEDEEVGFDIFKLAQFLANKWSTPTLHAFNKNNYYEECLLIGRFLSTMMMDMVWMKEETSRIRKDAYMYFLRGRVILRYPKKRSGTPLRVVTRGKDQSALMSELHDSP